MASELDELALAFEEDRARLRGVAYRILGSASDAWAVAGKVRVAFGFTLAEDGRIASIDLIGEPSVLADLDIEVSP
jgi:hypothetical protein